MIDPFTLTTGIVGIISLAIEVTKITAEYASGFQNAPTTITDLQQELTSLTEVLQQLTKFLKSEQLKGSAFHDVSVLCATKDACEKKISELRTKLLKHNTGGSLPKALRRLKWPLDEKESRQAVEDLHRYSQTFQFGLNIDGCALLSKTSDEVSMTLMTQLETLRETRKLAFANSSLKDELDSASQLRIQMLQVVSSLPQHIETATADIIEGVEQLKATSRRNEQREIYDWLAKTDPASNFNAARQLHEASTGNWFIKGKDYPAWKATPNSFLWLHGIPGSGKTVLSATIVDDLLSSTKEQSSKLVAYYYFDFNDPRKQQARQLIGSIATQVCAAFEDVPKCLKALFLECRTGTQQPSKSGLLNALRQMLSDSAEAYLVFDALDECSERNELFSLIQTICNWKLPHLHVLATSRQERDIDEALKPFVLTEISIQNSLVDADILVHIKSRMKGQKLKRWVKRQEVAEEIETRLVNGASGIYATYDKILLGIDEDYRHLALSILRWLAYSTRALTVAEVADVVAINYEDIPAFDPDDRFDDPLDILTVCSSLVTIETRGSNDFSKALDLRLAHFSVKEYLLNTQARTVAASFFQFSEVAAHTSIAEGGLAYLLHFEELDPLPYLQTIGLVPVSQVDFPLLSYLSGKYENLDWAQHLRVIPEATPNLTTLARKFFRSDSEAYLNWAKYRYLEVMGPDRTANPLTTASGLGWLPIVRILIEDGADIHERSGPRQQTALEASAQGGWTKVVDYLLETGANPNATLAASTSALQGAVWYNHVDVARALLRAGADVNAKCGHYDAMFDDLLQIAAYWHHEEMEEVLLDYGADGSSWVHSNSPYKEAIFYDMLENNRLESRLGLEVLRRDLLGSELDALNPVPTVGSELDLSLMQARSDALQSSRISDQSKLAVPSLCLVEPSPIDESSYNESLASPIYRQASPKPTPTSTAVHSPTKEAEELDNAMMDWAKVWMQRRKEILGSVIDNGTEPATTSVQSERITTATTLAVAKTITEPKVAAEE
ncbi:MAG: hypothetical protein M1812_004838 [Candelaria pacifica]|nr:MAG: hypothetical protein M1812_004838 [Candelaria pacifica]